MERENLFLAIDANAIVHRAYHAFPATLTTADGLQVNAVYGFTAMLLQALDEYKPKYVVCAFDTSKPTFRHQEFPAYKGHRKPTDQSLVDQFPLIEEVLEAFNIPIIKQEGFEADDILGTLSKWVEDGKWSTYGLDMYLLTGDRDFLQLIGEKTSVVLPMGSFKNLSVFDSQKALEKYGYTPEQVVDFKAMVGDASDNIPGVKGIGQKTGTDLLAKYGSLDEIYKNISELKPRAQKLLGEGIEQAEMSRMLATIVRDMNITLDLEASVLKDYDEQALLDIFKRYQFRSLIKKIPRSNNTQEDSSVGQLGMFGAPAAESDPESEITVYEDLEKADVEPSKMVWGYINEGGNEYFVGKGVDKSGEVFYVKGLGGFTELGGCETWVFNLEGLVSKVGEVSDVYSIEALAHIISAEKDSLNLSELAFEYLTMVIPEKVTEGDLIKVADVLWDLPGELLKGLKELKTTEYVDRWLDWLRGEYGEHKLGDKFVPLARVDYPVVEILDRMEKRGIAVDFDYLKGLEKEFSAKAEELQKKVYDSIGHEFNLNSPKQLAEVLFDELHLKAGRSRSTKESVLRTLQGLHPCIEYILEYREVAKVLGTYVKPFVELTAGAHTKGGDVSIHTDFELHGTTSGRFSSKNPNMQNIPARGDLAGKVRRMFVPREGYKLVAADYSQIESRVMADISEDPALIEDFMEKRDIHTSTAARILDKKQEDVTKKDRSLGKTINFGILFGQTPFGLAKMLDISKEEAANYIQEYFENYKGVEEYIRRSERQALDNGYVQSMFGRTRHVAGLGSRNRHVREGAIREAINMPIQGGEAEIMKLAMIKVDEMIKEKYDDEVHMLLQVHDELVLEVKKDRVKDFMKDIEDTMINVIKLKVPLEVHVESGDSLAELK